MKAARLAAVAALCAMPALAQAQTSDAARQIAARVEIHAIPSLTLTDQQFLAGDANGKPVTVTGEFRIAQGSGKLPVVVLIHGSVAASFNKGDKSREEVLNLMAGGEAFESLEEEMA